MEPANPLKHALALYKDGICGNGIDQALENNVGKRFVQHSSGIADGQDGFRDFYRDFLMNYPGRKMTTMHKLVDGHYCFLHVVQIAEMASQWKPQWVTMDLFDTDEETGKIIEHWSVRASYQFCKKPINYNKRPISHKEKRVEELLPMSICEADKDKTEKNKKIVTEYVKQVLTLGNVDHLDRFITPVSIRHLLHVPHTRECLPAAVHSVLAGSMEMLFKVIGQANLVVTLSKMYTTERADHGERFNRRANGYSFQDFDRKTAKVEAGREEGKDMKRVEYCAFDVYRLENERIVEQWSVWEQIMPRNEWANSGKF